MGPLGLNFLQKNACVAEKLPVEEQGNGLVVNAGKLNVVAKPCSFFTLRKLPHRERGRGKLHEHNTHPHKKKQQPLTTQMMAAQQNKRKH